MAPLLNRGRLKTGDEFNQHKKRSLVSLVYHKVKAGNKFWKEVSFFFYLDTKFDRYVVTFTFNWPLLFLAISRVLYGDEISRNFGLYRILQVLRDEVETNLDR